MNQLVLGLGCGSIAMFIAVRLPYRIYRTYALWIYIIGIISLIAVFIPHIGMNHGGARRWVDIGSFSFQPSEVYKLAFIIYFATWLAGVKQKVTTFKYGMLPYLIVTGISGALILAQPDTATFGVIAMAGTAMYISAGAKWRYIFAMGLIGILAIGILALTRPYIRDRIHTFINPTNDPSGKGYQIQQSLIAIGSGGVLGRGFGQSVQKFGFVPEPIGDSIFAIAGEEFGFVGSSLIILLYLFFALRGLVIASRIQDAFGRLLIIGIVILITAGSMVNIASMLGIIPLSGIPLLFMSHGGTALFFTLISVGIMLNVSKYQVKKI